MKSILDHGGIASLTHRSYALFIPPTEVFYLEPLTSEAEILNSKL